MVTKGKKCTSSKSQEGKKGHSLHTSPLLRLPCLMTCEKVSSHSASYHQRCSATYNPAHFSLEMSKGKARLHTRADVALCHASPCVCETRRPITSLYVCSTGQHVCLTRLPMLHSRLPACWTRLRYTSLCVFN